MKDIDRLAKLTGEGGAEFMTGDRKVMMINYQQISLCVIVETIFLHNTKRGTYLPLTCLST